MIWISSGSPTGIVRWLLKAAAILPAVVLALYAVLAVLIAWSFNPHGETRITIANETTGDVALLQDQEGRYRILVPACSQVVLQNPDLRSFRVAPSQSPKDHAVEVHFSIPFAPDAPTVETFVITSSGLMSAGSGVNWTPGPCVGTPAPVAWYEHGPPPPSGRATRDPGLTWSNPEAHITPSTGLKDGQSVTVTVSGFGDGSHVYVSECASEDTVSSRGCGAELSSQTVIITDHLGRGSTTFIVHSLAADRVAASATTRCTDQCLIITTLGPDYGWTGARIEFATSSPAPP